MMKHFSLLLLACSLGLSQQAWAQTKLQTLLSWHDNKAFEVYRNPTLARTFCQYWHLGSNRPRGQCTPTFGVVVTGRYS